MRNSPFRQGGRGTRGRIATGAKCPRNDTFTRSAVGRADVGIGPYGGLQGVRYKAGRVVREADPYTPFTDRTS